MGGKWRIGLVFLALTLCVEAASSAQGVTFTFRKLQPNVQFFPPELGRNPAACTYGRPTPVYKIPVLDDFLDIRYSNNLTAAREPSLFDQARKAHTGNSYRFTWLRSFHVPIVIRIDENADGHMTMVAKKLSRNSLKPHIIKQLHRSLTSVESGQIRRLFSAKSFAEYRVDPCNTGTDGSDWIVETRLGDHYRFTRQSNPPGKGPIFDIGIGLLKLSRLDIGGPVY
jgi:hypothetical protein